MNDVSWLMYASMVVWIVLSGYLFLLGRKAASLETRLRRLEHGAAKNAAHDGRAGE